MQATTPSCHRALRMCSAVFVWSGRTGRAEYLVWLALLIFIAHNFWFSISGSLAGLRDYDSFLLRRRSICSAFCPLAAMHDAFDFRTPTSRHRTRRPVLGPRVASDGLGSIHVESAAILRHIAVPGTRSLLCSRVCQPRSQGKRLWPVQALTMRLIYR